MAALSPSEKEDGIQLGAPADTIRVVDVLAALRGPREPVQGDPDVGAVVDSLLRELAEGEAKAAGGETVADVLQRLGGARGTA